MVLLQFPVGVPWRRIYVPMEGDRRRNNSLKIYLCKWWWVIKTKEDERKKKKEGVLEGCLLFSFLLFCLFFQGFFFYL